MPTKDTKNHRHDDDGDGTPKSIVGETKRSREAIDRDDLEKNVAEPQAIVPGTWPSPIDGYRAAVHGVAVTIVNPLPGDMLLPYPTGTPLAVGSRFWLQNGYYKSAVPT